MANEEGIIPCYPGHRKWEFFMVIVLLCSVLSLGCLRSVVSRCFPISCSTFRISCVGFFCSAFCVSGFLGGAFCICVLCFGCGTFFYSAFFSCSCFDYAFDSGFCFCRRLCLGSIVAVNCKSNRKNDYCKYEIAADAKDLFPFLFLFQTFFAMRFFLFITVYFCWLILCPPSNFLVITIQNNCENSVSGGQIFTGKTL